jgi:hypothetical protein
VLQDSAKITSPGTPEGDFEMQLRLKGSHTFSKKLLWMNLKELECMPN